MRKLILPILAFILLTSAFSSQAIKLYRTNSQIEQNITALMSQYPNLQQVTVNRQQKHCPNDDKIQYVVLGNHSANLKAIVTCNVHAHELITAQLCVDFINRVVRQNSSLLSAIQFTVFYLPNQVRQSVMEGSYCLRTNQNNIDLNRNFPQGFQQTSFDTETYSGTVPLSQPYTNCIDQLSNLIRPQIFLDIHSGQFSLVFYKKQDSQQEDSSMPILKKIQQQLCKNCRLQNVRNLNVNGQAFQYLKYHYNAKYSSLMEIYGAYNGNQYGDDLCLTIFNPLTPTQLHYYLNKWNNILENYFKLIVQSQRNISKQK